MVSVSIFSFCGLSLCPENIMNYEIKIDFSLLSISILLFFIFCFSQISLSAKIYSIISHFIDFSLFRVINI